MSKEDSHIDEVRRTHYVYLHKDKKEGAPFYVGKGTGKRAYATDRRSYYWKKKVEELNNEYDIEIVKDGLSETEAYEYEAELIKKYGRKLYNEGELVNMTEGGDIFSGDGLTISFEISAEEIAKKYIEKNIENFSEIPQLEQEKYIKMFAEKMSQPTNFKNLTKEEQKEFISSIKSKLLDYSDRYKEIIGEVDFESAQGETFLEGSIDQFLTTITSAVNKYNRRAISFREFSTFFEDLLANIESDIEKPEDIEKEAIMTLGSEILAVFNPMFDSIIEKE